MKWRIHSEPHSKKFFSKLTRYIESGEFSSNIIKMITGYANSDVDITFSSDDKNYIENTVDEIIGTCYSKNCVFDIVADDYDLLYTRNNKYQSRDSNKWYLTLKKITLSNNFGSSYHIHLSKNKVNHHILLNYDRNIQ